MDARLSLQLRSTTFHHYSSKRNTIVRWLAIAILWDRTHVVYESRNKEKGVAKLEHYIQRTSPTNYGFHHRQLIQVTTACYNLGSHQENG